MSGPTDRLRTAAPRDTSPRDGDGAKHGPVHVISRRRLAIVVSALSVAAALAGGGLTVANGGKIFQSVPLVFGLAVPYVLFGAFLAVKRPGNRMGWVLFAPGAAISLTLLASGYADLAVNDGVESRTLGHVAGWFAEWSWTLIVPLAALVLLLFPDGSPPTRRWRWVQTTLMSAIGGLAPLAAIALWPIRGQLPAPPGVATEELVPAVANLLLLAFAVVSLIGLIASIVSMWVRFHRAGRDLRHQMKWFFTAGASLIVSMMLLFSGVVPEAVAQITVSGAFLTVPVAIAVAVLRYRLYDIDIVISRTLVFAGLAAFITAIYVGIVVGIGTLLGAGAEPNLALSIVATAVVAVAFQPVRERLTRLANRVVFGQRATPYEVLSRFSEHLGEVAQPEQTLERMARLLVEGTGAARAQVWLRIGGQLRPAATWPVHMTDDSEPEHVVEVAHEGETLGALSVDKQRGESLTPADVKLVDDLAAQAGLVLRNLRLTEDLRAKIVDLQASRQRLVSAQDAERRRLERDLHEGAQRQLVELRLRLSTAGSTAAAEQAVQAGRVLEQVTADADDAIATLRELAHGIYPPLLAAEGLTGALTAQAAKAVVPVTVAPDRVGRYSQDVEAAVYFCVLEAVNNAAKYANPTQVTVRLQETDGHLTFEVSDDGDGFDPATTPKGHGTTNMTDRLDALGGTLTITSRLDQGTTVRGSIRLTDREVVPS